MNRRRQIPARVKRDRGFESFFLQRRVSGELRNRLHSGDRQPVSTGSNDDGLCPKPAHLQAPWIIGKRAFETDYCASFPGNGDPGV